MLVTRHGVIVVALAGGSLVGGAALAQPVRIASGSDPAADGYLDVAPDEYGAWTASFSGGAGPNDDNFNPAGAPNLAPVSFTSGFFIFVGPQRELLADSTDWQGVLPADTSLSRMILVANAASDGNGDGVDDTLTSAFRVFGGAVDLRFDLLQRVFNVVPGQTSALEQQYTITNETDAAITLVLVRSLDADLVWNGDFANDEVGTSTNGTLSPLGRYVFQQEAAVPGSTAVALSITGGDAYYGGKHGLEPGNGPPAYDFGTDTDVWDALGIPTSWRNHIAGVGYDTDGVSGTAPAGSTAPRDAFVGMDTSLTLDQGGTATLTVVHTYGGGTPLGQPPAPACSLVPAGTTLMNGLPMIEQAAAQALGAGAHAAESSARLGASISAGNSAQEGAGQAASLLAAADPSLGAADAQLAAAIAAGDAAVGNLASALAHAGLAQPLVLEATVLFTEALDSSGACGPCAKPAMVELTGILTNLDGTNAQLETVIQQLEDAIAQLTDAQQQKQDAKDQQQRAREQFAQAEQQLARVQDQVAQAVAQQQEADMQQQRSLTRHDQAAEQQAQATLQYGQAAVQALSGSWPRSLAKILRAQAMQARADQESETARDQSERARNGTQRARDEQQRARNQEARSQESTMRGSDQVQRAVEQLARADAQQQRALGKVNRAIQELQRAIEKLQRAIDQAQVVPSLLDPCGPCGEAAVLAATQGAESATTALGEVQAAAADASAGANDVDIASTETTNAANSAAAALGLVTMALSEIGDSLADLDLALGETGLALQSIDASIASVDGGLANSAIMLALANVASALLQGCCPGDIDMSGEVNVDDLVAVILAWGSDDPTADVNGDDMVGVDDLVLVILFWGPCL